MRMQTVDRGFSRLAATELPSGIKIEELNWPMPAMVLGFPQRFMLEYLGLAGN
jgi:hypothetical protein